MPMVSLKLMAGPARSMVVASARTTAAEINSTGNVLRKRCLHRASLGVIAFWTTFLLGIRSMGVGYGQYNCMGVGGGRPGTVG